MTAKSRGLAVPSLDWDTIQDKSLDSLVLLNYPPGKSSRDGAPSRMGTFESYVHITQGAPVKNLKLEMALMTLSGLISNIISPEDASGHEERYAALMAMVIKHAAQQAIDTGRGEVTKGFVDEFIGKIEQCREKIPADSAINTHLGEMFDDLTQLSARYGEGKIIDNKSIHSVKESLANTTTKKIGNCYSIEFRPTAERDGQGRMFGAFGTIMGALKVAPPETMEPAANCLKITVTPGSRLDRTLSEVQKQIETAM